MKRIALAESDRGEGEIKQKTTTKYKERTYSKGVLIFQKDSSLENTSRLLLLHFAKFSSSYRDKKLPQTKEDPPREGSEVQQILYPKHHGVETELILSVAPPLTSRNLYHLHPLKIPHSVQMVVKNTWLFQLTNTQPNKNT